MAKRRREEDLRVYHPSQILNCPHCNKPIRLTQKDISILWFNSVFNFKVRKKSRSKVKKSEVS